MTIANNQCTNPEVSADQKLSDSLTVSDSPNNDAPLLCSPLLWMIYATSQLNDYAGDHPSNVLNTTLTVFGDCSVDHCYTPPTKTLLFCCATIVALYDLYQHLNPKTDLPQSALFSQQSSGEKDGAEQPLLPGSNLDFNSGQ